MKNDNNINLTNKEILDLYNKKTQKILFSFKDEIAELEKDIKNTKES